LDADTAEAWELEQGSLTELSTFIELETFLESRIRALEAAASISGKQTNSKKGTTKIKSSAQTHAAVAGSAGCSCCGAAHYIAACQDFASKSAEERSLSSHRKICVITVSALIGLASVAR